jgi:hypothetical protein
MEVGRNVNAVAGKCLWVKSVARVCLAVHAPRVATCAEPAGTPWQKL